MENYSLVTNCETGETSKIALTAADEAQIEKDRLEWEKIKAADAAAEAKAEAAKSAAQAKLEALGLTAEDLKALGL